jgi:hypothetical protein
MPKIAPGREEEFRYLQGWLAASERLDHLVEVTEPPGGPRQAAAPDTVLAAAGQPDVTRAAIVRRQRVAALAQGVGRVLRRTGEGLEAWGGAHSPSRAKVS